MTRSKVGRSIANSGRRAGAARVRSLLGRPAGGRSFPPAAEGSFRTVAVIRVMLVASSNRTRENGQRSKSRVLPPRASRNPYDRTETYR